MALGLGQLGLSPRDFWSMTTRELAAAVRGRLGLARELAPPSPRDLARLMASHPDR